MSKTDTVKTLLQIAQGRLDLWLKWARRWKAIHWIAGTLGVLFSTLGAISSVTILGTEYILPNKLFSGIAAVIVAFIGFTSPMKQFNRHINAYMALDKGIRRFRQEDEESLNKAIDASEELANPKD
ncbi:hypothetical protein J0X19_11900 [Hymenobacter sp. BT186]|uniref:Uncharacterized protein n=1 Tax=Hymenobacter telluris TaxID=2816474 RepID=A0A939EWW7_9BACT|nr:hypothetical protein [Hymenobacter telluris]MBO0358651.1 hypothetical protein [Hymenobacter telluris]MBW3374677.1 hypothetical protein [Hymenobacter norwichensis]